MSHISLPQPAARLVAIVVLALGLIVGTATSATAAYPGPGNFSGNACVNYGPTKYVDNAGAEACYFFFSYTPSRSFVIASGAYDYARDGLNAETTLTIQQFSSSGAVVGTLTQVTTSVGGVGYSTIGRSFTVTKVSSASFVRATLRACTVRPNGTRVSCYSRYWNQNWAG